LKTDPAQESRYRGAISMADKTEEKIAPLDWALGCLIKAPRLALILFGAACALLFVILGGWWIVLMAWGLIERLISK
jgi:hypothetical protein